MEYFYAQRLLGHAFVAEINREEFSKENFLSEREDPPFWSWWKLENGRLLVREGELKVRTYVLTDIGRFFFEQACSKFNCWQC